MKRPHIPGVPIIHIKGNGEGELGKLTIKENLIMMKP